MDPLNLPKPLDKVQYTRACQLNPTPPQLPCTYSLPLVLSLLWGSLLPSFQMLALFSSGPSVLLRVQILLWGKFLCSYGFNDHLCDDAAKIYIWNLLERHSSSMSRTHLSSSSVTRLPPFHASPTSVRATTSWLDAQTRILPGITLAHRQPSSQDHQVLTVLLSKCVLNLITYAWWSRTVCLSSNPSPAIYNSVTGQVLAFSFLTYPKEMSVVYTNYLWRVKWININEALRAVAGTVSAVSGRWSPHGYRAHHSSLPDPGPHHLLPGQLKPPSNWSPWLQFASL